MCGRFYIEEDNIEFKKIINEISKRYKDGIANLKTGEVFPTDTVPVITGDGIGGRMVNLFRWGFPNPYKPGQLIINARGETVDQKPTFRKVLFSGRCLVPANGFFEWKKKGGKKDKYLIRSGRQEIFYMAGLYNTFAGKDGRPFAGFVIITTQANEQMAEIHDRMPVMFEGGDASLWLKRDITDTSVIRKLLVPYKTPLSISRQPDR
jgi:putative SOS response-associated peptidase YedK